MATKIFLPLLSLCFLIFLNGGLAERQQQERQTSIQNQCQFDQLDALEPQNRIEAEAGLTEVWDNTHQQFQCAGVAILRRRLERNALLLPSFTNVPQLVYIVRGRGYFSVIFPGCPETFQESQESQQGGRRQRGERQSFEDQHQKIRHFRQGDVVALPAGVTYWFYNSGEEPLVFVTLLDTSNVKNQLDSNPRKFFLAGNPEQEFQQQGEQRGQRGTRERQERRGERSECNNIFCGFDEELLAEAFNVDSELIRRLQNEEDNRGNIIKVEGGLQVTQPPSRRESGEEGGEQEREIEREGHRGHGQHGRREGESEWKKEREGQREHGRHGRREGESEWEREREGQRGQGQHGRGQRGQRQHGRREGESEWEREREGQRGQGQHGRREGESEWEREREGQKGQGQHGRREGESEWEREREGQRGQGQHGRREGETEWEREREGQRGQGQHGHRKGESEWERERERHREHSRERRRGEGGCDNGLEETFCSLKLRENIGDPSRADVFTPRAGRVSSINSHNLPVLNWLQLSAERGVLYRNAIFVPHWNLNAHSIMYVTRGRARVQVVDHNGNSVFDDEIQEGQVLTIPQNFAVLKRAGDEGFEWVSFKTNNNAMINPLVGRTSAIRGIPGDVLRNAFKDLSDEDVQRLKNNRRETSLLSPSGRSERRIAAA